MFIALKIERSIGDKEALRYCHQSGLRQGGITTAQLDRVKTREVYGLYL